MSVWTKLRNWLQAERIGIGTVYDADDSVPFICSDDGEPTILAPDGSVYLRRDGAAQTSLYTRVSNAWVALTGGSNFIQRLTTTDGVTSGTARVVGGRAFSASAASTAVTASGADTQFDNSPYTVPANTIKEKTRVVVCFMGKVTAGGTGTLTIKVRLNGTTVMTTGAITHATNDYFSGVVTLIGRADPAAAAGIVGTSQWAVGASGTTFKTAHLDAANFPTNAAMVLDACAQFSSGGQSCRLDIFDVDIV